jgi:hypothetical protein
MADQIVKMIENQPEILRSDTNERLLLKDSRMNRTKIQTSSS